VMISGLVNDPNGNLNFDDKANKHLDWWDKEGNESEVTLRDLLSFTSGLMEDPDHFCDSGRAPGRPFRYQECAKELYDAAKNNRRKWEKPGTTFQYLSGHLQFAGAMAVAASGKEIEELFDTYLYKKYNMTKTKYGPEPWNPSMAAGITSTGKDFEGMLQSLLKYDGLSKPVLDQMETDWTSPARGVEPSGDGWFGHYAMGHWWECLGYGTPSERAALPPICTDAHIQAGPGEFGYYPLIDRSGGGGKAGPTRDPYYMQVVLQEPNSLSGIPEYLRLVTKPVVDIIMSGADATKVDPKQILAAGGGLLARDVAFIKGELGACKCENIGDHPDMPYHALTADQPADDAKKNRDVLLAEGQGHTIFQVAEIQRLLGKCSCKGRTSAKAL